MLRVKTRSNSNSLSISLSFPITLCSSTFGSSDLPSFSKQNTFILPWTEEYHKSTLPKTFVGFLDFVLQDINFTFRSSSITTLTKLPGQQNFDQLWKICSISARLAAVESYTQVKRTTMVGVAYDHEVNTNLCLESGVADTSPMGGNHEAVEQAGLEYSQKSIFSR